MSAICFYFQVHQPYRIRKYRVFDIGNSHEYFDSPPGDRLNNLEILQKVARKSYLPANRLFLELLHRHPRLKLAYSLSGVVMDQLAEYAPETLDSFRELAATGRVEILSETYYHSLSFLYSKDEFAHQVRLHDQKVKTLFHQIPKVFRNTELIYNNELGRYMEKMGYTGIIAEGAEHILGWRSPNFLYRPVGTQKIKMLLKNFKLSDDIAFRFSTRGWSEYPLTAPKFARWVSAVNGSGDIVNLFMDYETFGEHQWEDTGIFEFMRYLPGELLKHPDNYFVTPSEAVKKLPAVGELDFPFFVSWADIERDVSAWLGNPMQDDAAGKLFALESAILKTRDNQLISDWRKLQTSDHFYYMCTKWFADGDVHKYFNPYESPYEAFIAFMNVLQDIRMRLEAVSKSKKITPKKIITSTQ